MKWIEHKEFDGLSPKTEPLKRFGQLLRCCGKVSMVNDLSCMDSGSWTCNTNNGFKSSRVFFFAIGRNSTKI